jgi:glutamate 5-kinase
MNRDLPPVTPLSRCRRLVIKLGTRVVLSAAGKVNGEVLLPLARQIAQELQQNRQIVLVSSGAVGLGRALLHSRGDTLPEKQALAAIGQVQLMQLWQSLFAFLDIPVAQVLLTRDDLRSRQRYLNASNTLRTLLDSGVLPIINENDSVATSEIRFGDNDILACLVGGLVDTDAVFNLTQAPGLLKGPQSTEVIPLVTEINQEVLSWAGDGLSAGGTGGMTSKLEAAKVSMELGFPMVVARAAEPRIIERLLNDEPLGTIFRPQRSRLTSRKRWLAAGAASKGRLLLDAGAVRAVFEAGKSLLPIGIRTVEGEFQPGDLVSLADDDSGQELGRGLVNYSATELAAIAGQPSDRVASILGYPGNGEAVHRDHLFVRKGFRG